MATTNISIRSKDQSGTTGTTTINYVNPEATSSQLQSLASAFNDLTTNEIVDVTRIDKQVLGSEIDKLPRNAQFKYNSAAVTSISAATLPVSSSEFRGYELSYDGMTNADTVFIAYDKRDPSKGDLYFDWWSSPSTIGTMEITMAKGDTADDDYTGTLIIYLPETDTYAAETLEIPVTN